MKTASLMIASSLVAASPILAQGQLTDEMICKAGIATVMGRDPEIIKVDRQTQGVIYLSYVRLEDRTRWVFRCRKEGQRILWASETGRWRNSPNDEVLQFETSANFRTLTVVQRFSDGSRTQKTFQVQHLR